MTETKRTVPELRFEGFAESWDEYSIRERAVLLKDGTHGTHKDVASGPLLLSAKNIRNGKILIGDAERRISEEDYSTIHKGYSLKENDILLTVVGTIGQVALYPRNAEAIAFQRSVAFLRFDDLVCQQFAYHSFQGSSFRKSLKKTQVVSAQAGVYLNDLSRLPISLPSLPEQKKIAEFFSLLDERISKQADKVARLREYKKGLSQRIFSRELRFKDKNGEDYPEWEEKKLGEIADWVNGFAFKPNDLSDSGTVVVKIKEMLEQSNLQVKTSRKDIPVENHLNNGDIIVSWSMTLDVKKWTQGFAYLNQHLYKVVPKSGVDKGFLQWRIESLLPALRKKMHGGTAKHLTRKDLLPFVTEVPSLPEQEKIAALLSTMDSKIAKEEEKLIALQEQKRGLMQRMFT